MADPTPRNEDDLTEAIFASLNGGLSAEERARFEATLAARPGLRAEFADWRDLRCELDVRRHERAPDAGLEEFTRRMHRSRPESKAGIGEMIERWMRPLYSPPRFAAALVLVVVQAGFLAALLTHSGSDDLAGDPASTQVRSITGPSAASLRVRFKPEATAREIATTLSNAGARIVDGPGQGGFYSLQVPRDSHDAAIFKLQKSTAIDEIVEGPNAVSPPATGKAP